VSAEPFALISTILPTALIVLLALFLLPQKARGTLKRKLLFFDAFVFFAVNQIQEA
jgi:hypothetical protein